MILQQLQHVRGNCRVKHFTDWFDTDGVYWVFNSKPNLVTFCYIVVDLE